MVTTQVSRRAIRDLSRLPRPYLAAVATAIRSLPAEPLAGKPLRGEYDGLRCLRVGTYRIVYRFDPAVHVVEIVWIRHRSEAYRDAR